MPKEMKSTVTPERRYFQATDIHMEKRADDSEGQASAPVISGYAAVFNEQVEFSGWMFREQIAEGAFTKSIKEDDVRALWNHDSNHLPLGRNTAGTLRLEEDSHGLKVEIDPPDTQFANDLVSSIERGDVSQMSFGFFVTREEWESDGEWDNRTILEASLFDVSPVVYPAYEATSVEVERDAVAFALESRSAWKDGFSVKPEAREEKHLGKKKSQTTVEIDIKLTDESRETLERIESAVKDGLVTVEEVKSETDESDAIVGSDMAEMKARQAELEDGITWAGSLK